VNEWTDEQRRQFDECYEKSKAEREAMIKVGDRVDTPRGPAIVVSVEYGGCKVNLEADLPKPQPGLIVNPLSGENAFYMPSGLIRKLDGRQA
jgi:hypothetical protein